jgi:hypothetical protein
MRKIRITASIDAGYLHTVKGPVTDEHNPGSNISTRANHVDSDYLNI